MTTSHGQVLLLKAKASLLAHLKREDEEMYPTLWQGAESDSSLKKMLEAYAKDMTGVSTSVLAFFEKYEGRERETNFTNDFREVYLALTKRIISEESKLFPEYEKLESC